MNKMDGESMDLVAENIAQMKSLFPEAVTEGKIDFDVLRALLGDEIEKREEYYKFIWNGKEAARAYARIPSMGTLRPCVEESSGKDGTPGKFDSDNLYIEGDNLEVLKLLQGSYHKRIRMIYIDPPYNTGKDFIYLDNYRDPIGEYKKLTGQIDDEGKPTRANPETSGRYHTNWLNMMYPRLILARNLLTDDGVIFISIDDSEIDNVRKLCNEVFGEENFITQAVRKRRDSQANLSTNISPIHEYVVIYGRSNCEILNKLTASINEEDYKNPDSDARGPYVTMPCTNKGGAVYTVITPTGKSITEEWRFKQETYEKLKAEDKLVFPRNGDGKPRYKLFLSEKKELGVLANTWWDNLSSNQEATKEIKSFFENLIFDTPKPVGLLIFCLQIASRKDSIILDFFSGSATAAHAVLQLNLDDGGSRNFIMVQLPEVCAEETKAKMAGYKNICEIGKERIRQAAKRIKDKKPLFAGDMGFKVFKLDTSNMVPWNPNADELEESLIAAVDNVLADRTTKDLLYEVLLKCNLSLTLPIEEKQIGENKVFIVGAGALAICLDKSIPQSIAGEIVKLRDEYAPIVPMQVVFRDNGFDDVSKTNVLQILKQAGFEEQSVRTI